MADGDSERAKTRSAGATLSANHYRIGLSASFLLWGCILILFFCLGQFKVWVKRDDLIGLAQTTAAVASIAMAVLAYLHDVGSKDRFFRLFLAALTFVLLLGTINGWLAALTMKPPVPPSNEPEFTGLALRFFVVGFIFFCTGVSGGLIVWRGARWPWLQARFDYSFFSSPLLVFAAFAIWPANASLAGITLALSIGAIAYLICFLAVLFFFVWREKSYDEHMVERVLETLRRMRADGVAGKRVPALVKVDELRSMLRSNDTTLRRELDTLLAEDQIFQVDYRSYYVLESEDWARCLDALQQFNVVVFGNKEESAAEQIANTLRLPSELVTSHLLPDALRKKYILASNTSQPPVYLDPHVVTRAKLTSILSADERDFGGQIQDQFKCLPATANYTTLHYQLRDQIGAACKEYLRRDQPLEKIEPPH